MQRMTILVVLGLLVLLAVVQLALPPLLERQVEARLTKGGGTARVELSAIPSPRLLFREGERLKVRATGLSTGLADPGSKGTLSDLDGFDHVDVQVIGMRTGPLHIARFTLTRDGGDSPYRVTVSATVTAAELSTYAGQTLGGGLGGFLGGVASGMMPGSGTAIPIDLDAAVQSDEGRVRALSVNGSVGGLPAGPLVEALAAALAGRL
jgi:hypothetical protein